MRLFALSATFAGMMTVAPFASVQKAASPQAPQQPKNNGRTNFADVSRLTPGVNGLPGTTVYLPQYYRNSPVYYNSPGPAYFMNRYNPYGYPWGPYPGYNANSGQFYAFMGGPAPTNPFSGNVAFAPPWNNANVMNSLGQPWNPPFAPYNFNNPGTFPYMGGAPFGQANGFLPNQQPAFQPPVNQPPVPQNNFGVQNVPGLNGFGNPNP